MLKGITHPTLKDWAKYTDPKGRTPILVEHLRQRNDMLDDMVFIEGNLPTGHRTTRRTELPEVSYIGIDEGVKPSKSEYAQYEVQCGIAAGFAEVDEKLARLGGKGKELRAIEDEGFLQALSNAVANKLIYGSVQQEPNSIDGFFRYYDTNAPECKAGEKWRDQILDAGGTGDNLTSLLLVGWGTNTICGMFPNGSKAGFRSEDLGLQTITDAKGGKYRAYQTLYEWYHGLVIRDPRYAVRIANIDLAALNADPEKGGADLMELMVMAEEKIRSVGGSPRLAFYCNHQLKTKIRLQQARTKNVNLTLDTAGGKEVLSFDGIPVRINEAMVNTESAIPAP